MSDTNLKKLACLLLAIAFLPACTAGSDGSTSPGGNVGFGGAQDIGQFRNILASGGIPGADTLDANGFFNEHFTELPPPDCGQTLCLQGMLAVGRDWISDKYQATLQIALNTPIDPATIERKPLDLVVVVDTSGSMGTDDRIGFVKQGLHLLIDALQDGDRLALVRYASDVAVLSDLGALDRTMLHQAVNLMTASGATNIYDGLNAGFEIAGSSIDPERQSRLIFLSDGMATTGITSDSSILEMAVGHISKGIGLTSVGVGKEFNLALMRGLSESGAGNFYFLEDAAAITQVFVDELDYFVTPIASSVNIEVSAAPAYRLGEVVGTRLWKAQGEEGSVFIPSVFVSRRTDDQPDPGGRRGGGSAIFVAMVPRDGQFSTPDQVAHVRMTYRLPGSEETIEQTLTVTNPASPGVPPADDIYLSHQAMAENYAAYNIYLGLRGAANAATYDPDCALFLLDELDREILAWNEEFGDEDIAADEALVKQFMGNLEEQGARQPDSLTQDTCMSYVEPLPYSDDEYVYACSAAGSGTGAASSWALLVLAMGLVVRRRRRAA